MLTWFYGDSEAHTRGPEDLLWTIGRVRLIVVVEGSRAHSLFS